MPGLQYVCSKWHAQVSIKRNNSNSRDTSDSVVRMEGKEEQGGHEGVQWKRLVNIICFIDLTVKACRLSFMLLWLAPLKIQQLQIKNDFLKILSVFIYFYLLPTSSGFACIIVKVSHISSSLWEAIMVGLCSAVLSLPKGWMALKRQDCLLQDNSGLF